MKYQVEAVLFDLDGVVVDSSDDITIAIQHTLRQLGQPAQSKGEIMVHIGHGVEMMIRKILSNASEDLIQEAVTLYRRYYLEHAVVKTQLFTNVRTTLEQIKNVMDKKTAVVTSKPEDLTRVILQGLGVADYFDLLIGPESVSCMKPDPEGIKLVLEQFNIDDGSKAIMIGDTYTDIEAGKAAGVVTCAVTYGFGDQKELLNSAPDVFIDDIAQLLNWIT